MLSTSKSRLLRNGSFAAAIAFAFLLSPGSEAAPKAGSPIAGQPAFEPAEWVLVANHLHSSPGGEGGWRRGVRHILDYCSARDIAFAFMTDHNTIGHWFFPEFRPTGKTVPVGGTEWTSDAGHANLVGFTANTPSDAILPCGEKELPPCQQAGKQDYAGMVAAVHARGGIVIINHPVLKGYSWPAASHSADAVEINRSWSDMNGTKARAWWHARLVAGERLTGLGGSDYHYFRPMKAPGAEFADSDAPTPSDTHESNPLSPDIDNPINLVRVSDRSIQGVLAAVRAGHVQVLADLRKPRLLIGCDVDGDGRFDDYMMGDRVRAVPGQSLPFQIRVMGGKGQQLRIIDARVGEAPASPATRSVPIDSDDFVFAFTRIATEAKTQFLRAEIGDKGGCVSNPVWF